MGGQEKIIEKCRDEISAIDKDIFSLIKKREQLSATIGQAKRELAMPDRDFNREKAVFQQAIALAKELDLPQTFAIALQKLIIEASLSRQEHDRIRDSFDHQEKSVAVIGGSGRLGRWLCHFFSDSGHRISVVDPVTPGFTCNYAKDLDPSIANNDIIVVATPIRTSVEILKKLATLPYLPSVIFDVSSVKAPVFGALCQLKDQGAKVTSLHPMFGPSVGLLFGKHLIRTSLGVQEADNLVNDIFSATSLNVIDMGIDEHDAVISILLSLSHIINIIFVSTIKQENYSINYLEQFSSPTFSNLMSIARNVMSENPRLYFEIQALNPHAPSAHEKLLKAMTEVIDAIKQFDEERFVAIMSGGKRFLAGT